LKGNNGGSNKNGKSHNKSWKNKAKVKTDDLKKELAALVKKATQLIKQQELNAIELTRKVEPIKKRKVKWPSAEDLKEEQVLDSFDAELKDFNYGNLEQLDLRKDPMMRRKMEKWTSLSRMKHPMKFLSEWQARIRKEARMLLW